MIALACERIAGLRAHQTCSRGAPIDRIPVPCSRLQSQLTADKREQMNQLFNIAVTPAAAAVAWAIIAFAPTTPATAGEYGRKDVTSALVSCSFETLEQCQSMSAGRGGDCYRDPF